MLKHILAAYDGSDASKRAFDFALELSKAFGARLTVLSVARPPEPPTQVETQALLESATEHFEEDFVRLKKDASAQGVALEATIAVGHPADQIAHHAAQGGCDMIVMGHRGKSLVQRWLLGSISKRVLSYAPCSVTVVR
jgi:nucleotide-binding universal stress UspA family protein